MAGSRRRGFGMLVLSGSLVLVGAGALAGCQSGPTKEAMRASGDRAFFRGDFEEAERQYRAFVDRDPADHRARYDLGRTLLKLDRPAEAKEHLAVAYDLYPISTAYLDAYCSAMVGARDGAGLYALLRSRCVQPGQVEDFLRLGRFAAELGDADEAERALLTAAKLDRGRNVRPHLALADFYASLGDRERTLERLRNALYVAPQDQGVQARIRELGQIPGPSFAVRPAELDLSAPATLPPAEATAGVDEAEQGG